MHMLKKRSLLVAGIIGLVCAPLFISQIIRIRQAQRGPVYVVNHSLGHIPPITKARQTAENAGRPARLIIPIISVDAGIEPVGVTANGALGTPRDPQNTAWYKSGPSPGEKGSAVIDGHYGQVDGKPAIFDALHTLVAGDKLFVEDEKGVTFAFIVRRVQIYGRNDDTRGVFVSNDGKAHLNLITCAGTWNKTTRMYSDRTVVFSDKE